MPTFTFLGTGTSSGVPMIACPCPVCTSSDIRDQRLRSSLMVSHQSRNLVIDSGPDFRQQMLRSHTKTLDTILYTHGHKDHISGMDDVRAFNYFEQKDIDLYADKLTEESLRREFAYVFDAEKYPGIPDVTLHEVTGEPFEWKGLRITPIPVWHYRLPIYGYRIGDFTYITDANRIEESSMALMRGTQILVVNALRHEKHISHFTLQEAIDLARQLDVPEVYFTHISHQLGLHDQVEGILPEGMHLAYDGLQLEM